MGIGCGFAKRGPVLAPPPGLLSASACIRRFPGPGLSRWMLRSSAGAPDSWLRKAFATRCSVILAIPARGPRSLAGRTEGRMCLFRFHIRKFWKRKINSWMRILGVDSQDAFHKAILYYFLDVLPRNFGCVPGMVPLENSCDCGGVESRHARGPKP